ncbi:hypothetical protein Tco_0821967 [Tanacetum coccineum]|uniref:Uncharacterized protein n=1 Tax=Tanacetum coccineum TaxID=301880 RepID=A0ABQ5AI28_9ASTR
MKQFRINQLEANRKRFEDRIRLGNQLRGTDETMGILPATIEINRKVEADRQFAEIMNALKARKSPTTIRATNLHFEENRKARVSRIAKTQPDLQGSITYTEKDVPFHGQENPLGDRFFGLELIIGLHSNPGRGEDRVTWNLGINYHPSERKWNFCLNSFIESNIMNNHVFQHFRPNDRHERRTVKRRVGSGGNYRR